MEQPNEPKYVLRRDGVVVERGTYFDCMRYAHNREPFSLARALLSEGYTMTPEARDA